MQSRGGERREGGKGCEDSDRVITRLFTLPDYRLAAGEGGRRGRRGGRGGLIKSDTIGRSYMCSVPWQDWATAENRTEESDN